MISDLGCWQPVLQNHSDLLAVSPLPRNLIRTEGTVLFILSALFSFELVLVETDNRNCGSPGPSGLLSTTVLVKRSWGGKHKTPGPPRLSSAMANHRWVLLLLYPPCFCLLTILIRISLPAGHVTAKNVWAAPCFYWFFISFGVFQHFFFFSFKKSKLFSLRCWCGWAFSDCSVLTVVGCWEFHGSRHFFPGPQSNHTICGFSFCVLQLKRPIFTQFQLRAKMIWQIQTQQESFSQV